MISFCKDCKFWADSIRWQYADKHECNEMEDSGFLWNKAYDQEGIFTKSDFGCVLFQPKVEGKMEP